MTWVQLPPKMQRHILHGNPPSPCLLGDGASEASPAQPGQCRGESCSFQELQRRGGLDVPKCVCRKDVFMPPRSHDSPWLLILCRYDTTCLRCCWPPWTSCSRSTSAWRGRQLARQDAHRGTLRTKTWWDVCKGRGMMIRPSFYIAHVKIRLYKVLEDDTTGCA